MLDIQSDKEKPDQAFLFLDWGSVAFVRFFVHLRAFPKLFQSMRA